MRQEHSKRYVEPLGPRLEEADTAVITQIFTLRIGHINLCSSISSRIRVIKYWNGKREGVTGIHNATIYNYISKEDTKRDSK
jgi:hypothetical protein